MKRWMSLILMLVAVMAFVGPIAAGEKKTPTTTTTKAEKAKDDSSAENKKLLAQLKDHFAELAGHVQTGEVQLNTKQLKRLVELQKARDAQLKEWDKNNAPKMAETQKKLDKCQDPAKQKILNNQLAEINGQRGKIVEQFKDEAEKVLNNKQKCQKDISVLYRIAKDQVYAIYDLDEDQLKKLEEICSRLVRKLYRSKKFVRTRTRASIETLAGDQQFKHRLDVLVYKQVMNKEQKKAFRQQKKQEEMLKKTR